MGSQIKAVRVKSTFVIGQVNNFEASKVQFIGIFLYNQMVNSHFVVWSTTATP